MILNNEKEYLDAINSLDELCYLSDSERTPFEDDIDLLINAITDYENREEDIFGEAPDWAVLEYHIYTRLGCGVENLPFTAHENALLYGLMERRENVPLALLERVRKLSLGDLVGL